MKNEIRKWIYETLLEFKEDIGKQCIVLMGLPASGKSTFINNEIKKYFPGFKGYKVSSSDQQVMAAQFQTAKNHFEWLKKNIKSKKDILKFINVSQYVDNNGAVRDIPLTYKWWVENNEKGLKNYYRTFYKPYYATYFDIRDLARVKEKQLFQTKIITSGNLLVIDTTATNSNKILNRLNKTKEKNFSNVIIYLEIDPILAIQRDKWRQENMGRGVGVSVIFDYAKQMKNVYNNYIAEGNKEDGVIDRLMHFIWKPMGDSPIKGTWILKDDNRYSLKRRLKSLKEK